MSCDHKFVDSNVCLKCGVSFAELKAADAAELAHCELMAAVEDGSVLDAPSYTDDVVAVMRDTITALREEVARLREEPNMCGYTWVKKERLDEALDELETQRARIAEFERELQRERDRRVEHRQMNQALNEQVQRLEARLASLPLPEGM